MIGQGERSPIVQNVIVSKQNVHSCFAIHCTLHDSTKNCYQWAECKNDSLCMIAHAEQGTDR